MGCVCVFMCDIRDCCCYCCRRRRWPPARPSVSKTLEEDVGYFSDQGSRSEEAVQEILLKSEELRTQTTRMHEIIYEKREKDVYEMFPHMVGMHIYARTRESVW